MPDFALCGAVACMHQNGHQHEKSQLLQVYFHKYYWNVINPYQLEDFKIKLWIYTYKQQATRHHSEYRSRF